MFTAMFKKLTEIISIPEYNNGKGYYQFKNVLGGTKYISGLVIKSTFPVNQGYSFSSSNYESGVSFGTGTTPPSESDYNLESTISSGIGCSLTHNHIYEVNGSSHVIDIVVTNTSSSPITISEIGWKILCMAASSQGGAATYAYQAQVGNNTIFLADRTLLESPVTIPAGEYAVIRYTLGESASAA